MHVINLALCQITDNCTVISNKMSTPKIATKIGYVVKVWYVFKFYMLALKKDIIYWVSLPIII